MVAVVGYKKWSEILLEKGEKMSDALKWARKRGLECEQDIMAAQLKLMEDSHIGDIVRNCLLVAIFTMLLLK